MTLPPMQCGTWLDDWHQQGSCTTITLDGIRMIGTAPRPTGYGITAFDGWDAGAPHRGGPVPYATADGGIEGQVTREGRNLSIKGLIYARDARDLAHKREDLGAILSGQRWADMVVTEDWLGLERMMRVTRTQPAQITPTGHHRAVFTLDLVTASAERLDAAESALTLQPGKAGSVLNIGNLPASLTLLMRGPLTNPSITVAGQQWRYEGSVPTGRTLTVDMSRRDVRDPATNTGSRRQAFGVWPTVPEGATAVSAGGTGSGTLELRWRSTWS